MDGHFFVAYRDAYRRGAGVDVHLAVFSDAYNARTRSAHAIAPFVELLIGFGDNLAVADTGIACDPGEDTAVGCLRAHHPEVCIGGCHRLVTC